ncbi:asparagine synthase C-terminal domain-containing protein [Prescottella sp. R16]|uniref:asparagine synthase C-terminal domain-containing protein n=1 Tax=Prescottella sp. R16 TaxID=3064529 RepID=UPI00272E4813|nr:asparagine synthase-related protein [Prescottella sp. R16]
MRQPLAGQTATGVQYVADCENVDIDGIELRTITDADTAALAVADETADRLRAVFDAFRGRPIVLLSGGVDSILVAATAATLGTRPHAITVVTDVDTDDYGPASAAAQALGLTHEVIYLTQDEVVDLAERTTRILGTAELYEVAAAIPLVAARNAIAAHAAQQDEAVALLTGSGADAIFAGGRFVTAPIDSPSATAELDAFVRAEVCANFVRHRLVPDYYERVLGDFADNLVHVFQTERFWQIGRTLAPPALFRNVDGTVRDKMPLRIACSNTLPSGAASLAWTRKSPIQRSTGVLGALTQAARASAACLPGAGTYSDPLTEPIENVAVRLYLHHVARS